MENTSKEKRSFKAKFFALIPMVSLIGIVVGAIGGYIYYVEIGCTSGTCPLTSNPYMSILWGGVMGYLIGDMFRKKPKPVKSED